MLINRTLRGTLLATASAACLVFAGCSGNTGGGDSANPDYSGDTFSANEDNTGSLTLSVNSNSMSVSETSGFVVEVKDANGAPVPNINVSCDTESGLALIEPTSGSELTDGFGSMSGIVGCTGVGSFQMACRLPIGANARKFETIKCAGPTPDGFSGFTGSAGGGLFGGTASSPDGDAGDTGLDGIVITRVDFLDLNGTATTSIDTTQDVCTPDDPATAANELECEPFSDTLIRFTVTNNTNQNVELVSYSYVVPNSDGSGTSFTSSSINLNGTRVDAGGTEKTIDALFIEATLSPADCGGVKRFAGATSTMPSELSFQNFTIRLVVRNELGDTGTFRVTAAGSLDNYGNC